MIRELFDKVMSRKKKVAEIEEHDTIMHKLQEKKKSANERELERYMEEDRQKNIKIALERYRKQKQDEFWHQDNISQKFMFKSDRKPLKTQGTILNKAQMGGGMFFK